jgi:hypothetical protein
MYLPRDRVARLIELSALERTVTGPERLLREEDVALLIKAAYDDATEEARAAFMALVKPVPTSLWPWSAVQAVAPRGGGGVIANPMPPVVPALFVLLRGQVDSPDADPGNRICPTATRPRPPSGSRSTRRSRPGTRRRSRSGSGPRRGPRPRAPRRARSRRTPGRRARRRTTRAPRPARTGTAPGTQPPPAPTFSWRHPAVIAAGATMATTVAFSLYAIHRSRTPAPAISPPKQETP